MSADNWIPKGSDIYFKNKHKLYLIVQVLNKRENVIIGVLFL